MAIRIRAKTPQVRFTEQRRSARRRRIKWQLTFDQWWKVWNDSGKYIQRGHRKGQYVMSRFGDKGPYAIGNIEITLAEKNGHDAHRGRKRTLKNRANIADGIKAYWAKLSPEERAERGRRVSVGQAAAEAHTKAWKNPERRKKAGLIVKRRWAKMTPAQRAAYGKAISKGKRRST